MKILYQPEGSKTCGHHCVAMIAEVPVFEVVKVIGHTNGTRTKEIAAALRHFGFNPAERLKRFHHQKQLPVICMLKIIYRKNSHWVVYNNGFVYCPGLGVYRYHKQAFLNQKGRATSFLKIN